MAYAVLCGVWRSYWKALLQNGINGQCYRHGILLGMFENNLRQYKHNLQFIVAALIAVCAAGRLEHLERSYLPPDNSIGGSSFGSHGAQGGFGSNGFGTGNGRSGSHASQPGSFPGATSNQYLPPNQGSSLGSGRFGSSPQGINILFTSISFLYIMLFININCHVQW